MFRLRNLVIVLIAIAAVNGVGVKNPNWKAVDFTGTSTSEKLYPFGCGLSFGDGIANSFCSGIILDDRIILTAASCFDQFDKSNLKDQNIWVHTYYSPYERFLIEDFRLHSDYDPETQDNDIAIITTGVDIPYHDEVQPGEITTPQTELKDKMQGVVLGFSLKIPGIAKTSVTIVPTDECQKVWPSVSGNQICVMRDDGECLGEDKSYPFIQKMISGEDVVSGFGIYTGTDCSDPTVYTNIAAYTEWIDKHREDSDESESKD